MGRRYPSCFETARHGALKTRVNALKARLLSMRGVTIARAGRRAKPKLWLFPVLVLFRPVIDGQVGRPTRRRRRGFLVFIPPLTGKDAPPGCSRPPVFLLLFAGKNRRRGGPSQVAAGGADHYLTRC